MLPPPPETCLEKVPVPIPRGPIPMPATQRLQSGSLLVHTSWRLTVCIRTHTYIQGYTIRFMFSDFSNTFKKDDSYVGYCSSVLDHRLLYQILWVIHIFEQYWNNTVHHDLFTFLFELQAWDLKFTAAFSWINEK